MKLRKRDLFLLVAAPALMLGAIGTAGMASKTEVKEVKAAGAVSTTAATAIESGTKYLITAKKGNDLYYVAPGTTELAAGNVEAEKITLDSTTEAMLWTFTATDGGYTIKNESGYYLANAAKKANSVKTQPNAQTWVAEYSNNSWVITGEGDRMLALYETSNWRSYASNGLGDNINTLQLYPMATSQGPSLTISTNNATIVAGRSTAGVSLTASNCTPDAVTWTSSNPSVATVVGDTDGATITGLAEGKTTISVTYNEITSNTLEITVQEFGEITVSNPITLSYSSLSVNTTQVSTPTDKVVNNATFRINKLQENNATDKRISMSKDGSIMNMSPFSQDIYRIRFKRTNNLPHVYACDGLSTELTNEIEATDRTSTTGYIEYDMSSYHTKFLTITGTGTNSNFLFEEAIVTFASDKYTVLFDVNNGFMEAEDALELDEGNSTITLPTPARDGYEFAGWDDGTTTHQAGEEVTIYADTMFTAKWDNVGVLQPLVNGVESKMALAYRYTSGAAIKSNSGLIAGSKYVLGFKGATAEVLAGGHKSTYLEPVSAKITTDGVGAVPTTATVFTLGGSAGAWTLQTSDGYLQTTAAKAVSYNAETAHTWSIDIAANGDATMTSVSTELPLRYNSSSPRFTTYATGQQAPRLYRVYETPVTPQFRLKVGVDSSIVDLATADGVAECGVAVTAGNTTQRFALSDLHTDDTGIRYVTIDLGDVVNNYSRATTAFMVRAYVKSGDDYIYTTDAEKYENLSVRDMVNVYHGMNEYKDKVDGLWSFFNAVSAY